MAERTLIDVGIRTRHGATSCLGGAAPVAGATPPGFFQTEKGGGARVALQLVGWGAKPRAE